MVIRDCIQAHELVEDFFKIDCLSCVISCAPYLEDEKGHGLTYHSAFEKIINNLGLPFQAYISRKTELTLNNNWKPFFSKRSSSKVKEGYKRTFEFLKLINMFKKKRFILFLESFTLIELAALYLSLSISKPSIKLWILLRYPFELLPHKGKLHCFFFNRLKKYNLSLFTDSSLIAEEFINFNFAVLPIPHTEISLLSSISSTKEIKMWWPGEPRAPKGLKEIQFISRIVNNEFTLLVSESTPIWSNNLKILRVKDSLSRKEFLEIFDQADIILLPYNASHYRASTSGLFVEAVVANKIPFVKEGTWLADECKKFNLHSLILDWDRNNILESIKTTFYNKSILNKLSVMRKSYLEFHNCDVFSKIIKKHINESIQ